MKQASYPPIIIFLDLLFIFLFLFILNTNKVVEIEFNNTKKLFSGAEIIVYDEDKSSYFTLTNNHYYPSGYTYLDECPTSIRECEDAYLKFKKVFVVYPSSLQKEISEIMFLSLGTNICSKMKFFIKLNGTLDYKKMLKFNRCLKKIDGYKNLLEMET
jgi:hypothetical protein